MKIIISMLSSYKHYIAIALLSLIIGSVIALIPPLIIKNLIDNYFEQSITSGILQLAFVYLGAITSVHLFTFISSYLSSIAAQGALKRVRIKLFGHLQQLPISFHNNQPMGDTISRCTSDIDTIDKLFSSGVINLITGTIRTLFALVAMISLSPSLSLVLLIILPLLIIVTRKFQKLIRKVQRFLREAIGELNSILLENLNRMEVIKIFQWEEAATRRFRVIAAKTLNKQNTSIATEAVYSPILKIFQAILVAFFLAASRASFLPVFNVSIGTLTAFILLFDQFFNPLIQIGNEWQIVQSALAGLERITQILAIPITNNKRILSSHVSKESGLIIENLNFGYSEDQLVLADINLEIEPETHLAIVGRTGAGKSTLIQLICGLYKPWSGFIKLNGLNPAVIPAIEMRNELGVVPQTQWMFSGTIRENLTFRDKSITTEQLVEAARITGADKIISLLPKGYETIINDTGRGKGVKLSIGEKQLLALTRALIGNPSILLLDEATASIDSHSEVSFKKALHNQIKKRKGIVITVAHRISTAAEADIIIFLENGRIVEMGYPKELLRQDSRFAALWVLENAHWDWQKTN